jgi:hypothetical protein
MNLKSGLLFVLFCCSFGSYAQFEIKNKSAAFPIPKSNFTLPKTTQPSLLLPKKETSLFPSNLKQIGEPSAINFMQKNEFANPGKIYEDKLNKKPQNESQQVYRSNQFLGDFKTKSKFVHIQCRDYGLVDGDRVSVVVNDIVVNNEILLTEDFRDLELTLNSGFNKIEIIALNQGTSGPNTAEFQVFDEQQNLISANQWNLATGFKATLIIVKQ